MGYFNMRGYLSHATISYGDDIVFMIGFVKDKNKEKFYTLQGIVPICLPIYGKYNDYGNIEYVEDTPSAIWIKNNLGDIKDVVEAVAECQNRTIGECINSDNKYHPDTNIRYVYDNMHKIDSQCLDMQLCCLFEHREIYETWIANKKSIPKCYEIDKILNTDTLSVMFDRINFYNCFGCDAFGILSLQMYDGNFLKDNIDEVIKLQKHILWMTSHHIELDVPMQYTQDLLYNEDIDYHKKCIEFLKKKKKEKRDELCSS